jgi:hypothetical protein
MADATRLKLAEFGLSSTFMALIHVALRAAAIIACNSKSIACDAKCSSVFACERHYRVTEADVLFPFIECGL